MLGKVCQAHEKSPKLVLWIWSQWTKIQKIINKISPLSMLTKNQNTKDNQKSKLGVNRLSHAISHTQFCLIHAQYIVNRELALSFLFYFHVPLASLDLVAKLTSGTNSLFIHVRCPVMEWFVLFFNNNRRYKEWIQFQSIGIRQAWNKKIFIHFKCLHINLNITHYTWQNRIYHLNQLCYQIV